MAARTYHTPTVVNPANNAIDHIWTGLGRVHDMLALRRQRKALAELEDHQLNDIGVSREEAETEAARPAWDVPNHWRARR